MNFQYALECCVKGKNSDIKGAISIIPITRVPPLVCPKSSTHAGINSSSSYAMGNFSLEFLISDEGEHDAAVALTEIACNNKNRKEQKFQLTRYTVHEDSVIPDLEVEFNLHYLKIALMDCESENKRHIFEIVSSQARSEIQHSTFSPSSGATKLKVCRHFVNRLFVDAKGNGIIQRG